MVRRLAPVLVLLALACPRTRLDPTEPNNTLEQAYLLTEGDSTAAAIDSTGDVDWFYLRTPSRPGVLTFRLAPDASDSTARLAMALYDMSGDSILFDTARRAVPAQDWLDADRGKEYYVKVSRVAGAVGLRYSVGASFAAVDDSTEPNDDFGQAFAVRADTDYTGYAFAGEPASTHAYDDFFFLTLDPPAESVRVALTGVPSDIAPWLVLYDTYYRELASDSAAPGTAVVLVAPVTDAHCYIRVGVTHAPPWFGRGAPAPTSHSCAPYALRATGY